MTHTFTMLDKYDPVSKGVEILLKVLAKSSFVIFYIKIFLSSICFVINFGFNHFRVYF